MLTSLTIENFKRFERVEIPLSDPVLFVGPNNSGKTTALQALALWDLGLRRWKEKRGDKSAPEKRPGVTINRRDILNVPIPTANLLWRNLRTRFVNKNNGKQDTQNIRINILVEGKDSTGIWKCALEFDYSNEESVYCRPMRADLHGNPHRHAIPEAAYEVSIAYLPPMSGLAANELRLEPGAINVRLGEGRTAEVLRNLCFRVFESDSTHAAWERLCRDMHDLFHVELDIPEYIAERGEIQMTYRDDERNRLDLSCAGRGLQQTLLLLSYLPLHPNAVLLLDEPDAHLEIIRQREIFLRLVQATRGSNSQLIVASHSEEVLNQALGISEDAVVAFLGKPHRLASGRGDAVRKAIKEVPAKDYYQALQTGWVLYLEDVTDLLILRAFADRLQHPVRDALRQPFLMAIGNQPNRGRTHFNALQEAKQDLVGCLIVDSDAPGLQSRDSLSEYKWTRREIENYLCQPETLVAYVRHEAETNAMGPLLSGVSAEEAASVMQEAIHRFAPAAALENPDDSFWRTIKASSDFLDRVFKEYFAKRSLPLQMRKVDYHLLVSFVPERLLPEEIREALDLILATEQRARPFANEPGVR